ncbi:DUF547 domain-containing protein [Yeosuana marina]|uniref:DUF547 domain-containing protein n=1 Tax=Yeosuana marina TaxID=1565536 RepID=UPI0030EEE3C7|tara:strand:+ start:190 stop:894 length:705 start_codon:yes stop_codon:yes gene_type:complete
MKIKFYSFILCVLLSFSLQAQKTNHSLWTNFLKKHVSSDGHVDYKTIHQHPEQLETCLQDLSRTVPDESWTKNETLAFWINAYNAFTLKLILDNYPITSIKDIKKPWEKEFIKTGSQIISLSHIEHDILRKMNEPRIHFAIVCASVSCPKLLNEAYTAENLENQLTRAAKDFLSDSSKNSISTNNLELSKLFKWFGSDFTKYGSLIDFLNVYSDIQISNDAKIKFKNYNWDLND